MTVGIRRSDLNELFEKVDGRSVGERVVDESAVNLTLPDDRDGFAHGGCGDELDRCLGWIEALASRQAGRRRRPRRGGRTLAARDSRQLTLALVGRSREALGTSWPAPWPAHRHREPTSLVDRRFELELAAR